MVDSGICHLKVLGFGESSPPYVIKANMGSIIGFSSWLIQHYHSMKEIQKHFTTKYTGNIDLRRQICIFRSSQL